MSDAPGFFKATVARRRLVTPGMMRVTVTGAGANGFAGSGVPDEFVRLFFADPETGELPVPEADEVGRAIFPEGVAEPHNEYYSIRWIDLVTDTLDIDFVVHPGGIASEWAQSAKPGDPLVIGWARYCYEPPTDIDWQILLADATGLPALGRIVEETSIATRTIAVVEIGDTRHKQDLAGDADITWLPGSGNGLGPSALPTALRNIAVPEGNGYIWAAGELKPMRAIRRYLRNERRLSGDTFSVVRYWIDKKETWRDRWDALDPAIKAHIDALWSSGRDRDEIADEYQAILERHGL